MREGGKKVAGAAARAEKTGAVLARLSGVTLRYGANTALDALDLEIHAGERLCVLGGNGSGKSTLASVICGLLAPDEGDVNLLGEAVCRADEPDLDAYRTARRGLGLVFQNPDDQIVTSVVADDVAFGPENLGLPRAQIAARVERELKRVALLGYAEKDPSRLSGGQRQRVCIAGALAMEPQLLVLDEPSASLDVRGRRSILRVMGRLHEAGTTLVHVTHFMEEALLADRVIVMSHGKIALSGTPDQVFCEKNTQLIEELGLELPFEMRLAEAVEELWGKGPGATTATVADSNESQFAAADEKPGADAPACAFDHVSFSYAPDEVAVNNASFTVAQGATCAIVGQTGSGKSTALRLLCGLETPDAGSISVMGVTAKTKRERRAARRSVGYVMQHPEQQLFAPTVAQDVAFGPTNLGLSVKEVSSRVEAALDFVGLSGKRDAAPFELSGGQRRLAAIAGVLVMRPSILVLDEPLAGLDPRGRALVRGVLERLRIEGTTVIQVTHSMEAAARADQVVVFNGGRVVFDAAPAQVFSKTNAPQLKAIGLGVPESLEYAWEHAEKTDRDLGDPLTLEALAQALATEGANFSPADAPTEEATRHGL